MADRYVSRPEIAARLGLTERQVTNLVARGRLSDGTDFPSRVSGRSRTFPTDRCFDWYIRFKQEEALERAASRREPADLEEAELRKAIADAETAELKLAILRGDAVPKDQYRRELTRTLTRVASRFRSMPGAYAHRFLEPLDMAQAVTRMRDVVSEVLAELQTAPGGADEEEGEAEGVA